MEIPSEISFVVRQNDKGGNPKRPDYRGEVKLGAMVFELAAWRKKNESTGRQYVSGTLKLKQKPAETQPDAAPSSGSTDFTAHPGSEFDEDRPF